MNSPKIVYNVSIQRIVLSALIAIFASLLLCCNGDSRQYAVLLSAQPNSELEPGTVVEVLQKRSVYKRMEKQILISYRPYRQDGQKYQSPEPFLELFDTPKQARQFTATYDQYKQLYAKVTVNGLKLRGEPATYARIIHRLTKDETVKIIERNDQKDEADAYTDYWYYVLTEDGEKGYCFGHYLSLYEKDTKVLDANATTVTQKPKIDPMITEILSAAWCPEEMYQQLQNGYVDKEIVKHDLGLSFDQENKTITIRTLSTQKNVSFNDIKKLDFNSYTFPPSSVIVERVSESKINLVFFDNDKKVEGTYRKVTSNSKDLIKREKKRQEQALQRMLSLASTFKSNSYGTLTIDKTGSMLWEMPVDSNPYFLPVSGKLKGELGFTITRTADLQTSYDDSVRIRLETKKKEYTFTFLIRYLGDGMQWTYVPEDCMEENRIIEEPMTPYILFFKGLQPARPEDQNSPVTSSTPA